MSAPIDVLAPIAFAAVVGNEVYELETSRENVEQEARRIGGRVVVLVDRAAVAELIEAGSALAAAQVKFDLHGGDPDECSAAWERHAAALARVRGAA